MKVVEINDSNIEELVKADGKTVVDCYAPWCSPCRMLAFTMDELSTEMENVHFYKINIDDNEKTTDKYDIMSIPTVLFFEDGELKDKLVGLKTKDEIKTYLI